eukprot:8757264-Alexandrium_andersonii.AAC.1
MAGLGLSSPSPQGGRLNSCCTAAVWRPRGHSGGVPDPAVSCVGHRGRVARAPLRGGAAC